MARRRIHIQTRPCRRCGRSIAGLTHPIHSSQATYEKYAGICEDCTPAAEQEEMHQRITDDVMERLAR